MGAATAAVVMVGCREGISSQLCVQCYLYAVSSGWRSRRRKALSGLMQSLVLGQGDLFLLRDV